MGSGLGWAQGTCEDPCPGPVWEGRAGSARCWLRGRAVPLPGAGSGAGTQMTIRPSGCTEGVSFLSRQLWGKPIALPACGPGPTGLSPGPALPSPARICLSRPQAGAPGVHTEALLFPDLPPERPLSTLDLCLVPCQPGAQLSETCVGPKHSCSLLGRWVDGRMDRRKDGWMDGQVDRWVMGDGWLGDR